MIEQFELMSFQNPNLWEFYFIDYDPIVKFWITEANIPMKKFTYETNKAGQKYCTGFTPEGEFSLTFRETATWEVCKFFKKWQNTFYDEEE